MSRAWLLTLLLLADCTRPASEDTIPVYHILHGYHAHNCQMCHN